MNLAFPALVILLLIAPGFLATFAYRRGTWRSPATLGTFQDEVGSALVVALAIHTALAALIDFVLSIDIHFASWLFALTGGAGAGEADASAFVARIATDPYRPMLYLLVACTFGGVSGLALHKLVRALRLDLRYDLLRFRMTSEIVRYEGSKEARASAWASLADEDLKRRAVTAANTKDAEALWGLTEAFLVSKGGARSKLSRHTVRNYKRGVLDLLEAWQGENVLRPSRNAPDLYVTRLDERYKPGTIRVKIAAARALYKALRLANATKARPFEDLDLPPDPTPAWEKREPYTDEEVERLLEKSGRVNRVIVLLGAHAGLRASEIVALEWSDVDLEAGTVHVRSGKGGKEGTVTLSASTVEALRDLRPYSQGPGVLGFDTTQNAYERIRRLARRALLGKGKGLHALRHYCGTRIASELGLEAAQQHLRHSNMATTQVYAKWKDRLPIKAAVSSW